MDQNIFAGLLDRPPDSHKYKFGHVLVVGGSPGMVGAPLMAGMAALRTGAGLVTIAAPDAVTDRLERRVKEIMTLALPAGISESAVKLEGFIKERRVSVIAIGPGLAVNQYNRDLLLSLLNNTKLPMIVDGGALGVLKGHADRLLGSDAPLILTPHAGEFQRLVDEKLPGERAGLKPIALFFARTHNVELVLKGQPTYVAHKDGSAYENTSGNPGLATAGTGDVLSGIIAGLLAQGLKPSDAADAGVYLHGLAGDIAEADKTQPGMIAGDVIEAIPAAFKRIARNLTAPH